MNKFLIVAAIACITAISICFNHIDTHHSAPLVAKKAKNTRYLKPEAAAWSELSDFYYDTA
jgi:hypothetical protein